MENVEQLGQCGQFLLRGVDDGPLLLKCRSRPVLGVLERDDQGRPSKVRCKLHVERGPVTRDFDLTMEVKLYPPGAVRMSRV